MSDVDFRVRVVVHSPVPEGWDPDVPWTGVDREGVFTVQKNLTTSDFILTEPDGTEHLVQDPFGKEAQQIVRRWAEG